MKKKILSVAASLMCVASFAQNINPTVEVTNIYQGNPSEVHKPQIGMAIPDSLLRFDMDFGYEVFEKPYQGAYNFKPYMLAMKPDKDAFRGRKLYLKAGAGYSLHPQLDFVFSPEQKGPFQMSVYAGSRSFFGKYNTLSAPNIDGIYTVTKVPQATFGGYDMRNSAGFEGTYSFPKAILSFGVGYEGIMSKDDVRSRSFNAADFNVRIGSNRDDDKYIFYDLALNGRFAGDHMSDDKLGESIFSLSGNAGPVLGGGSAVLIGFEAETASYTKLYETNAGRLALIPKYRLTRGKLDASLGVRAEVLLRPKTDVDAPYAPAQFQTKGSAVFPDVHISYGVLDNLTLFASATGGNKINTFSSIISRRHFILPSPIYTPLDNSVEKVNVKAGIRANAASKLQIEVGGGFAAIGNGIMDSGLPAYSFVHQLPGFLVTGLSPLIGTVTYSDYNLLYADALVDLKAGNFRFDGGVHIRKMTLKFDDADFGLSLPPVSTDFKAVYEFNSRVYAGFRGQTSGARRGKCQDTYGSPSMIDVKIPGWFDLGLLAGWQFNRKLGFWLESGNLLCETIQRSPFYSEKDFWITAGITLSL